MRTMVAPPLDLIIAMKSVFPMLGYTALRGSNHSCVPDWEPLVNHSAIVSQTGMLVTGKSRINGTPT